MQLSSRFGASSDPSFQQDGILHVFMNFASVAHNTDKSGTCSTFNDTLIYQELNEDGKIKIFDSYYDVHGAGFLKCMESTAESQEELQLSYLVYISRCITECFNMILTLRIYCGLLQLVANSLLENNGSVDSYKAALFLAHREAKLSWNRSYLDDNKGL
jgi:hypothetical protein